MKRKRNYSPFPGQNIIQLKAWIEQKNSSSINSEESLGFYFSNKPNDHLQINNNLINQSVSRSFVIRRLAGVKVNTSKFVNIYSSIVRSVLEYSSVTYGLKFNCYDCNRLEKVKKAVSAAYLDLKKNIRRITRRIWARNAGSSQEICRKNLKNPLVSMNTDHSSQRSGNIYTKNSWQKRDKTLQ